MAYLVQLPTGQRIQFPDEVSREEAYRLITERYYPDQSPILPPPAPPTTIGGELMEVLKGLPRGAAGLLETAASGAAALLPDQAERELRGEITEFFRPVQEGLAPAAGYEESIGARAGEALGSTLPFLAAGPLGVAGRIGATGLGVAAGAGEARLRAEQEGGMEDRGAATALGALVGATEVIPIFRILNRLPEKEVLGTLDYVKRAAAAGGEEFAQEASANVAQNLIEKGLYNPEQEVFEGAAEEGAYGFGVGAFIQGLTDLAMGRRVRGGVEPPGGEDELAGIGAEQTLAGADTGGIGLPVSRIGAAGSDVEGTDAERMGVPSDIAGGVDEGAEALQPALEPARFQIDEDVPRPWYYSALERAAERAKVDKTKPDQWLNVLRQTQGVKQEEIDATGLEDWLKLQGDRTVTKQEIADYVKQNGVQVEELLSAPAGYQVFMDGDAIPGSIFDTQEEAENFMHQSAEYNVRDAVDMGVLDRELDDLDIQFSMELERYAIRPPEEVEGGPKYAGYQVTDQFGYTGENYRELLLTLPPRKGAKAGLEKVKQLLRQANIVDEKSIEVWKETGDYSQFLKLNEEARALRQQATAVEKASEADPQYESHNWPDVQNVLAHIRIDDRRSPVPGLKRDLFVQEVQSDWGQDARKYGYRTKEDEIQIANLNEEGRNIGSEIAEIDTRREQFYTFYNAAQNKLAKLDFDFEVNAQSKPEFFDKKNWRNITTDKITSGAYRPTDEVDAKRFQEALPSMTFLIENVPQRKTIELERNKAFKKFTENQDKIISIQQKVPGAPLIGKTESWLNLALKRALVYAAEGNYDSISFAKGEQVQEAVGGEKSGQVKFYNEILPQALKKLAPKFGGKLEIVNDRPVIQITPEMRSNLLGGVPLFRMKKEVAEGLPPTEVEKIVKELSSGWANKPNIKVVPTYKDLPKPYRVEKYKNARGMLLGNDVYIVAANAGSASDVKSTLFHESLGHYGLRDLFRTRLNDTLSDIYKTNTAVQKAADEWLRRFPNIYPGSDRTARAVEEILAAKSEKGVIKEPGIRAAFNRLAAMIRKFIRAMGLKLDYSNNDINNILLEAAERVRSQPGPVFNTDASPRFQISQYNKVLSNVLEQNQKLPEWSQSVGDGVVNAMSRMPENLRKTQFYIYSMPQVIELLERYVPRIRAIDRFIGYRASYTTDLMKTASDNHAKYTEAVQAYPDKFKEFNDVVNDINLFQVQVRDQAVIDLLSQPRASLNDQKKKYYDIAKRFYDLPVRLQNSILSQDGTSGLFADYRKMGDKKFEIFSQVYGGQLGMGVVRDLRERFERERLPMYAPLARGEGTHWLYYETTDGRQSKEVFESEAAREVAIRKAIEEGRANANTIVRATRASEIRDKGPPPTGFLAQVIDRLESTIPDSTPADVKRLIIDGVYDTFISSLPSDMLRQELSSRQTFEVDGAMQFGVLGFDQDALAVYERQMPKMAYQLGNLKFALPIENAMKKVMEQAKLYEIAVRENNIPQRLQGRKLMPPKAVYDGVEDMRRRLDFAYNPTYAPWVNGIATANYIYSIAGNVSSALINTTVLLMMTLPSLVGKYGTMKSIGAMTRAMKMFAEGGVDDQGNFTFGNAATGEAKTFFDYLTKRGVIGIAAEQELRQAQRAKIGGYQTTFDKLNYVMGYVFKNSERFNREVTMLASFMLAREKGKSFKTAAEEAIRLNNNINGTVLPESASRLYQTNLGRVILTFRTFALTQIINLSRMFGRALNAIDATPEERNIARKQMLGVFGMTYMVAGLKGLPLFSAAEVLAAALMGDDDEPYDLQQEVLDSMGLLGLNGPLNAAFNVDIASRTGFNGMLWRDDPKRLAELGYVYYAIDRLAGPTAGLVQAQVRGFENLAKGEVQRGFESILPAPIRNPLKAARYATEGALTKNGQPIVDNVDTWNQVMQVFGFAPAELAATQEQIGTKFAISDKLRNRRTALLTNLYTAITTGDSQATEEAFEAINNFNGANPMIGIDSRSIIASFRERSRRAGESINGIYLPQKLLMTTDEYMADLN